MEKSGIGPRVRFAPSPTGHLHVGGIRSAIFNWLFARHSNGKFLVRIEDTDIERSKKEYVDSILESLSWLGLESDEKVVFQTSRLQEYKEQAERLLQKGLAYPCFCSPPDAKEKIEQLEEGRASKYDGSCRSKNLKDQDLAKPHALRFKLPSSSADVVFNDVVRGKIAVSYDQLDDFVIIRRDGMPTYNFAVVVDDIFMKISHVIRGEDHISNSPKQILLYKALEASLPVFVHVPLILGKDGRRLSKRDSALAATDYREAGFLADALFNYLVRLGWSRGDQELFSKEELVSYFRLEDIGKKGAVFDLKKLEWVNGCYLRKLSYEQFLDALKTMSQSDLQILKSLFDDHCLASLFELYRSRANRLSDIVSDIVALKKDPAALDVELIEKWRTKNSPLLLEDFLSGFEGLSEFSSQKLLVLAEEVVGNYGEKLVNLAQATRLAIVGKVQSPSIFELMEVLGKEVCRERVKKLAALLYEEHPYKTIS